MSGHTPTPWGISYGFEPHDMERTPAHYVAGPDPKSVGIKLATPWIEGAWDDDGEARANAALIVKAVNAYEPMREALAGIKWKSADRDNMEFSATITCWQMDRIRAALALANPGDGE